MEKAYLFLADGFEEVEALTQVDLLRRADVDIKTVSITDSLEVVGRSRIKVTADEMWGDHDRDDADMLILPGGMPGTQYLMEHEGLRKLLKKAADDGKWVCAICAAPTVLADIGILEGKKATCYPGLESKLKGAEVVTDKEVVKSGKVITSRGPGTSTAFGLKLIDALKGDDCADMIRKDLVYGG